MTNPPEYKESEHFNEHEKWVFISPFGSEFYSGVDRWNGAYYTTHPEHCQYKATTIRATQRTVQDCLDELDEKAKILKWLITGAGIHCLPIKALHYLTKERICELYNVEPEYFK
jgi:hypothetical protein